MDSSEQVAKDVKSDEEGWGSDDKSKHRSRMTRTRDDDDDGGDNVDSRKRSSDGDSNFEVSEKSLSKQARTKPEEDTLGELSSWYNDGDLESKNDNLSYRSEREKAGSSFLEHESSQSRKTYKHDGENEKIEDRDSRSSERREYSREKENDHSEQGRNSRRRWDEPENNWEPEEEISGSDSKVNRSSRSRERDDRGADGELEKSQLEYEQESSLKRGDIESDDRVKSRVDSRADWELHKRSHDRIGGRKEGIRSEAVKTSSKYGISSDNYDVIEIQTKKPEDRIGKPDISATSSMDVDNGIDSQSGKAKSQQISASVIHESSPFNRAPRPQGGRGWGRPPARDSQPIGISIPLMAPPFGPLGMSQLNPPISISPGIFLPPFAPPVVWPGPRGVEMGMLGAPLVMQSPGHVYPPNIGTPQALSYSNLPGPGFSGVVPRGRMQSQEKVNWVAPPRTLHGKAPSRGEQNDYSQNFVDTGMHPQNFIRELELTSVVEDYPKLRELIQKKDEIVANSAAPPMYFKSDLREFELSPEFFGTKFDVILVDPPWEEYVHRAPGVTDHMEYWTFEEIMNLKIEAIADTPSFLFLWVGNGIGLEQGRQCLKKWGFRRCEDICWVKTNKTNATPGLRHDFHTLFQRSKEHCLMGIKGTVRRSTDGHIIHANIDTDVIIAEEPPYGSTAKPEDMYRIIEHFALGCRRLELFGEDHNIRAGWLTVGKGLSSSNFDSKAFTKTFSDKDGKVWQGGGGRNPPPEAPHLILTTPDIEALRPKSPMKNQLQLQQQSASISINTVNSVNNKRPATVNSPFHGGDLSSDASSANLFAPPPPWVNSGMDVFKGNLGPYGGVPLYGQQQPQQPNAPEY
ncbi:N6-adenosine-methyltransferase non-catalytic subunit MTB-like [Impatiens glandulifera]|uniref:N6-adenosine-methyltransferase non-catalytic subunit MTB-like n=1 Tax=Impatiens glandulifera TaxID=253017 RepID=UPI001FB16148|nr:N6-adenosine-methyltransferase non-catalytic subunit MTB-like [Impatiens glandulifera]